MPRLIPVPIIGLSLTYKSLIYELRIVNWSLERASANQRRGRPDRCSAVGAQHAAPLLGKTVAPRRIASHSEIFAKNVELYRGRAYARARMDGEDCGFGFAADFNFRMEEFGQRFDARDEARAGA